jgi:hypothetical protein
MSRAAINQQLFNQAVGLGLSPNFTGKGGKGRYTAYLQNLIASYRPPTPEPPPPPPPPQQIQATLEVSTGRSRLSIGGTKRTRRSGSQPANKRQLSFGLNAPGRASEGGISF